MATSFQWAARRYKEAADQHGASSVKAYNAYQHLLDVQRQVKR